MTRIKSEESNQSEPTQVLKTIPHKRIQTAEGWKRSQRKTRKSSTKPAGKS